MNLVIPFTPTEEARLSDAARQTGLAPAELIKRLTLEHLPSAPANAKAEIDATLGQWQQQEGVPLMPDLSTQALFAQWAEEDAQMTEQEREAEERLWEDMEKALSKNNRLLNLRRLG